MISNFLNRVPWAKFFLLWFLALLMGTSLLWLHYSFTKRILEPESWLFISTAVGLLWATTRPRWEKAYCSWCGSRVRAKSMKYNKPHGGWVMTYECQKCGHLTEKAKSKKV
jgi:predicted RNA-binding Zn-ribbon protein involved in translation (DUF1610 family)